ncbi:MULTISPECIES: high-potential iron-sulfur protein [Paraburkholderia]|uniref:High-potential iron-sulfur protein n=1 Tax=Paraburkholderia podalyriae TaxID=1938811 RepID=A0ABR7PUY9_9BURK|nr:high-potential iron-sulfur protein [Paraburkholderia podalyriae]MBC8750103.1 High potential iron-sulfur protein [Paraburkholderia podalyriae]
MCSTSVFTRCGSESPDWAGPRENDPTAQALGYKMDASKVDKTKSPRYQAGQTCANCQLYQGKPGSTNGPCPTYGGKLVDAKGWCNAYVKKA